MKSNVNKIRIKKYDKNTKPNVYREYFLCVNKKANTKKQKTGINCLFKKFGKYDFSIKCNI